MGEIEETDGWSRRLSRVGRSAIAASRGRPSHATGAPCDGTRARPRLSGWVPSVADGPEPDDEPDPSAEVAAAPGELPRLGKEDIERLVEPFERLGSHLLKNTEKPEARIACDQHMETWWLMQRVLQDRRTAPAARLREPPAGRAASTTDAKLCELLQLPQGARWLVARRRVLCPRRGRTTHQHSSTPCRPLLERRPPASVKCG